MLVTISLLTSGIFLEILRDSIYDLPLIRRNDALYKASTPTTSKPFVVHTTAPPAAAPLDVAPILMTAPVIAVPSAPSGPRRSAGPPRRPYRRRRPQFYYEDDYYDDYYDDLPRHNRGRKRPRPRPRPLYDDDYDEYDDGVYERQAVSRRRPYDRRGNTRRRNKDEFEYEDDDSADDFRSGKYKHPFLRNLPTSERNHVDYEQFLIFQQDNVSSTASLPFL